jgi:hypothetical protein
MKPFTDNTIEKITKAIYGLLSEFLIAKEIVVVKNLIKIKVDDNTSFLVKIERM